jgi:hypothetical protein
MKLILKFLTTLSDAGSKESRPSLILRWMMLCTTQYFDFGLLSTLVVHGVFSYWSLSLVLSLVLASYSQIIVLVLLVCMYRCMHTCMTLRAIRICNK